MPIPWTPKPKTRLPARSAGGTIVQVAPVTRIMPRFARFTWLGLAMLAAWESGRGLWLSADRIERQDVEAMAQHLAAIETPIVAHRAWLEPSLRRWFPQVAAPENFGAAAPSTWSEFWTLAHRSDPGAFEEDPALRLQQVVQHGALVARQWRRNSTSTTIATLGLSDSKIQNLRVSVDQGPCRITKASPLKVRCPDQSSLTWELAEIDYRARLCLAYRTYSLSPIQIEFEVPWPAQGARLLGRVGFSDFNARLRGDAALSVQIYGDEQLWFEQPFSDAQGWASLSHPVPPPSSGQTTLPLRVQLLLNANRASSKSLQRQVIPCLDLRLQGPAAPVNKTGGQ